MTEIFQLTAKPLTAEAFRQFGQVIETAGVQPRNINQGFAKRYNNLCHVDVASGEGKVNVSLFTADPRSMPIAIKMMERHPFGTQAFIPMQDRPWLVLVADDPLDTKSYHLFSASGRQGVSYNRNTWHHPLLVFDANSHFLVVDRIGPGDNLDEVWLPDKWQVEVAT